MSPGKRILDLTLCLVLGLLLWPVVLVISVLILLRDGRPVFFLSERMKTADRAFLLVKFRTMTTDPQDGGVSGGDKAARITATGRVLRRYRLDEIPQLWNILKGDISFVGPRPPLRRYVEMFPELYGEVLRSRPGLTGLATMMFHRREAQLLAGCRTAEETEATYIRRCVPVKARLDLIYGRNKSVCYDLALMSATLFGGDPARKRRS
ncbi:sugar transferase [Pseudooceanicola sp. LIPI14-2-Ac024]|uniref:sugar transferase n=1 Tax=Pseudooceanicola sp. LIPI14-2-Ac024 TaxID=3344875 RepID=UPI0035D084BC